MVLAFLKLQKKQFNNFNYNNPIMETVYLLIREGIIYEVYDKFLNDLNNNNYTELSFNTITIEKLTYCELKIYCHLGDQPDPYPLYISTKELINFTSKIKSLIGKEWETIRIEFDGNIFEIFVDDKPYQTN